jgi:transcriptional regulator with XRE-family HTH domain
MDISELLDAAKRKRGKLKFVADELGVRPTRLSEWRAGTYKPDATQIAQLAELAELPIFETVAQVEASLEKGAAGKVWERALGKLRAAGIAASVTLALATSLTMGYSNNARAAGSESTLSAKHTNEPLNFKGFFVFCANDLQSDYQSIGCFMFLNSRAALSVFLPDHFQCLGQKTRFVVAI